MGSTQDFAESLEAVGMPPYAHPLSDRRAVVRQKLMCITQMTPWAPGHASVPFDVVLEDTSDTGAGVTADRPCALGMRHLLMVPRGLREPSVMREYNVVRCEALPSGKYLVGLELIAGSEVTPAPDALVDEEQQQSKGSQLKLLMLAFALACLLVALFMPL